MNKRAVFEAFFEFDSTVFERVDGEIFAQAHAVAGVVSGAALADDDVASDGLLTAKEFNAQAFADAVASVIGTTYTFLVCHDWLILK